jgi:hypothetical protein
LANIINGTDTGSGGLITTGDSSDELQLQTAETTAITITSGQQSVFIAGTAAAPAVTTTGDLNTGIFFPAGDAVGVATNGAEAARFNSSGNLVFPNGQGIDFSASAGGGASSSLLDDYEDGTWTPTASGATSAGTGTYTNQDGRYTKIGNTVTIWMDLGWSAHTGTGNLRFSGLPFTANLDVYSSGVFGFVKNLTLTANSLLTGYVDSGTTAVALVQYAVGGSDVSSVAMDTSCRLMFTVTYRV